MLAAVFLSVTQQQRQQLQGWEQQEPLGELWEQGQLSPTPTPGKAAGVPAYGIEAGSLCGVGPALKAQSGAAHGVGLMGAAPGAVGEGPARLCPAPTPGI